MPLRPRSGLLVSLVGVVALTVAGCGGGDAGDGIAPDTARFTYGDRSLELPLDGCGREGDVVVLGGGLAGVAVLQAAADLGEGGLDRTGVTADIDGVGIVGAFGRGLPRGPAGEVTDVRVEGDRLVVEGRWTTLDEDLTPTARAAGRRLDGRLVARCPEDDTDKA